MDRKATLDIVRTVLAADCACPAAAFAGDGLLVTPAAERAGRRRYPMPARPLLMVTMGCGVVVSCHPDWTPLLHEILAGRTREEVFAAPSIAALSAGLRREGHELQGPAVSFVCAPESLRPTPDPDGITIRVVAGDAVPTLYQHPGFGHALSYDPHHPRPDVAAAVARRGEEIVGIAGMSADCDAMWQIGIDVVPSARGAGIGRALVRRLTTVAFQRGRVPLYVSDLSNLRSQALATSLGYWPAWVLLFARERPPAVPQ